MWILSPLTWLLLAGAVLALSMRAAGRGAWLRRCAWMVCVLSLALMTPLAANMLLARLEAPLASPADCNARPPSHAVVLAAGVDGMPADDDDFTALDLASRRRVEGAVSWWADAPGRRLVLAGGLGGSRGVPYSRLMAAYARQLGVDEGAMMLETGSRNTWENAWHLTTPAAALPRRVTLVTSAMHMRRAEWMFRQAGFAPCPLAVDPRRVDVRFPSALVPRSSALDKSEEALHEIAGLAYYRLRLWLSPEPRGSHPAAVEPAMPDTATARDSVLRSRSSSP